MATLAIFALFILAASSAFLARWSVNIRFRQIHQKEGVSSIYRYYSNIGNQGI